jgi:Na+/melibiose symporter-like transporter
VYLPPGTGGFAYESVDIAMISSICGAIMPPVQLIAFPPFCRKHGPKKTFLILAAAQAIACTVLPFTAPVDSGTDPNSWAAFVLLVLVYGAFGGIRVVQASEAHRLRLRRFCLALVWQRSCR